MKDADLERFPSLLFVTRQDSSEIVFCNNYTVEKIGRPLNAIVGSKLSSIVTHATEVFFESYMRPILVSTPFFEEALITLKTHDNRRIPCVANIAVNEGMLYWSIHFADKRDKLYQELIEARDNLERQAEQLSLLARVDPLTNLLNRRAANNDIQILVTRLQRQFCPVAILLIDVDHFKHINDTYGHDAGDDILVALASILKNATRCSDIVARWGGEEFLIVLYNSDFQSTSDYCQRLHESIHALQHNDNQTLTVSIGVMQIREENQALLEQKDSLIKHADNALYRAKDAGRNQTCFAEFKQHQPSLT